MKVSNAPLKMYDTFIEWVEDRVFNAWSCYPQYIQFRALDLALIKVVGMI